MATCSAATGSVRVKRKGEGFWADATVGTVFRSGDWVQTGPGATARVDFLGSAYYELNEDALIVLSLENAPATKDGAPGTKQAMIAVQSGEVRGVLPSSDAGVVAPMLFATADGKRGQIQATEGAGQLEFRLSKRHKGSNVEVSVNSGQATVALSGEKRTLNAGSAAEAGQALKDVVLLRAPGWTSPRTEI